MRRILLAALAAAASFAAAPAFAADHGHSSYGHTSYKSYGHGHRHVTSYNHYRPSYHAPTYHAPTYHAPTYSAPTYEAPKPKVSYETRPAYVYQKVAGYCTDVVKSYGYNSYRKQVECKAGDAPKAEHKVEPKSEEPPK